MVVAGETNIACRRLAVSFEDPKKIVISSQYPGPFSELLGSSVWVSQVLPMDGEVEPKHVFVTDR
jgi:hypothetical protein